MGTLEVSVVGRSSGAVGEECTGGQASEKFARERSCNKCALSEINIGLGNVATSKASFGKTRTT